MKLKCNDGIVRCFQVAREWETVGESIDAHGKTKTIKVSGRGHWSEALCLECGFGFGVHDTKSIKSDFLSHVCKVG